MTELITHAIITSDDVKVLERNLKSRSISNEAMCILNRFKQTFKAYEPGKVEIAREQYHRDGECEVDEGAVCSRGTDHGLYVQAWVWVSDDD